MAGICHFVQGNGGWTAVRLAGGLDRDGWVELLAAAKVLQVCGGNEGAGCCGTLMLGSEEGGL